MKELFIENLVFYEALKLFHRQNLAQILGQQAASSPPQFPSSSNESNLA